MNERLLINGDTLTVDEAYAVAADRLRVGLAPKARERMLRTRAVVDDIVRRNAVVYGITTGFGKLSEIAIPPDKLAELQVNVVRSHAAGVGDRLPEREVRAMMLLRANVIAKGYSGARPELVDLILEMLNADVYPPVPEQGSVGASGDLAPLAHLALALIGEGTLIKGDREDSAAKVLREIGAKPVVLAPKEGITLINGTQAHTAVALIALVHARALWRTAHVAGAMSLEALLGTPVAFDERIHDARGQRGQSRSAALLRDLLADSEQIAKERRRTRLTSLAASVVDSLVEGDRCAKQSLERHCARHVGGAPQCASVDERDERHSRMSLSSIDEGDAFLRSEDDRLRSDLTQDLCGRVFAISLDQRSLADESEREVRERREITTRANASLLRNRRIDIGVQHLENEIDELGTRAGVALCDHVGAEEHHRSHFALRQAISDSRRMAADDIHLQLGQFIGRYRDL